MFKAQLTSLANLEKPANKHNSVKVILDLR